MPKERLDKLVAERGLAESREQAQRLIMAGQILVEGHPATKSGHRYNTEITIEARATARFVSRGGEKLEAALQAFSVDAADLTCMDVGASTGGFTDCLLQHGAQRVYALDVGHGQLHWKLRNDDRVVCIEGFNARYLKPSDLPELMDMATIDASFISLTKILPAVIEVVKHGGQIIALIKPQFEAERKFARKGVVRDPIIHQAVVDEISRYATEVLKLKRVGVHTSPITGPAGNVEFLICLYRP
ncbi:MAG: TlyA family RNA methyltransferase [Kiritimatiellae bacterium]|nr:TlyA family RNA methyltransferase [Kiritimatiellia bacterium]